MTIIVCALAQAGDLLRERSATHVVSLLGAGMAPPVFDLPRQRRLHLTFNDIDAPSPGLTAPHDDHIAALLQFLESWDRRSALLVHCWQGVSRSTAAGYIAGCVRDGVGHEEALAQRLREAAAFASPNTLLVALADKVMRRGGAMTGAVAAIGRGRIDVPVRPFEL